MDRKILEASFYHALAPCCSALPQGQSKGTSDPRLKLSSPQALVLCHSNENLACGCLALLREFPPLVVVAPQLSSPPPVSSLHSRTACSCLSPTRPDAVPQVATAPHSLRYLELSTCVSIILTGRRSLDSHLHRLPYFLAGGLLPPEDLSDVRAAPLVLCHRCVFSYWNWCIEAAMMLTVILAVCKAGTGGLQVCAWPGQFSNLNPDPVST